MASRPDQRRPELNGCVTGVMHRHPAAVLGRATEEIAAGITVREIGRSRSAGEAQAARFRGAKLGALLNATFGNVPELRNCLPAPECGESWD